MEAVFHYRLHHRYFSSHRRSFLTVDDISSQSSPPTIHKFKRMQSDEAGKETEREEMEAYQDRPRQESADTDVGSSPKADTRIQGT